MSEVRRRKGEGGTACRRDGPKGCTRGLHDGVSLRLRRRRRSVAAMQSRAAGKFASGIKGRKRSWTFAATRCAPLALALIIGLGFISGASAQSGNPIRIGMSLALTGAGAAPSKVINTALEMWRDDVNAKGGLLGRPVELVIYDDQSAPANVPNIYTKLITVDNVDLLLGPYGTNFVAPAMPTIIQNNKMTISFTAIGINDKFRYPKYFSMVSIGPEGVNAFSIGFFDLAAAQTAQATDRRDPCRRRRVRPERRPRRPRANQEARLQDRLRQELSAEHNRFRAGGARGAGHQSGYRLCRRLSAGQRRHHPRRQRDRAVAEDDGRRDDRYAGDADQGPARPSGERPDRGRELRRSFGAENPRLRRLPQTLWGKGGGRPDRPARLRLGPVRLFGRPDAWRRR